MHFRNNAIKICHLYFGAIIKVKHIMRIFKFFYSPEGEDNHHAYETKLEKSVDKALTPFEEFVQSQIVASSLLIIATIVAIFLASMPIFSSYYTQFVKLNIGLHIEKYIFTANLQYWVNDILLTLFFLVIGLEIKREFLVGEFSNIKRISLIFIASFGSMVLPLLIYLLFNHADSALKGWAIPLPIGTAFTVGILALFRNKFPKGLISFITAIAIIDDIVTIIIIAIFYSDPIVGNLAIAAMLLLVILVFFNIAGIRKPLPYIIVGIGVWILTELSGVHGTIVGVLVAFTIPARPKIGPKRLVYRVKELMHYFEKRKKKKPLILEDDKQHTIMHEVRQIAMQATTPLQRWERALELPVALIILPLFVFANVGIPLNLHLLKLALYNPIAIGVALALVVGKPLGIISFSYVACKLRISTLPRYTQFKQVIGAAILGGIGFTLSLFIADLGFSVGSEDLLFAKTGIIFGSLFAAVLGTVWLMVLKRSPACDFKQTKECL